MFKNQIIVRCENCFTNTTINPEDIDVSSSSSEESMGTETIYDWKHKVECSNKDCTNVISISDNLSEYPVGMLGNSDPLINGGIFAQGPEYDFHGEPDEE